MVVDRIPRRSHPRLTGHERAIVGVDESRDPEDVIDGLRHPVVGDDHRELVVLVEPARGCDREFATISAEHGTAAIHVDAPHFEPVEVEVEARQVLRCAGLERGPAVQHIGRRVVGEVKVVVRHVVPTVARQREVRIADAGSTR